MKINEILTEDIEQLDELNWKKAAAAATLAGAGLFGGGQADAQTYELDKIKSIQVAGEKMSRASANVERLINQASSSDLLNIAGTIGMCLGALESASESTALSELPNGEKLKQEAKKYLHVNKFVAALAPNFKKFPLSKLEERKKIGEKFVKLALTSTRSTDRNEALGIINSCIKASKVLENDIYSSSTQQTPKAQPQTNVSSQDAEILSNFKGWFERIRNTYGEVDQKLVDKLSADGLDNLVKSYSNFRSDYSKIQSPEVKKQYEKLLLDLKKDIDKYHSFIENMYKQMPSLPTK